MTPRDESTPSRAGVWGLLLAVSYAVFVRFYQAAGGTSGLAGSVPRDLPAFQFASYAAGVVILLGGVACLVLTTPRLRNIPARRARGPRRAVRSTVRGADAGGWLVLRRPRDRGA